MTTTPPPLGDAGQGAPSPAAPAAPTASDPAGLLARLDALIGRLGAGAGKPPAAEPRDDLESERVPRERLRAEQQRRAELEVELVSMRGQFASALASQSEAHAVDRDLLRAGIDDDIGRELVRKAWEGQPKAERGKSPAEWWGKLAADPKAAEGLPKALRAYLPAPAPAPAAASASPWGQTQARPPVDAGTAPAQGQGPGPKTGAGLEAYLASLPWGRQ